MRFPPLTLSLLLFGLCASAQTPPSGAAANSPPQTAQPDAASSDPTSVFHVDTRLVVVDVVATAHDGEPVRGLEKDSFQLLEDGKPQRIQIFEEHVPAVQPAHLPDIKLPADEYTNFPKQVNGS